MRDGPSRDRGTRFAPRVRVSRIRVMTYNIHRGVGVDRQLDLERIADVIAAYAPDVLALQEVDVRKRRSGMVDQASFFAARLDLELRFGPTIEDPDGERYGIATLTRLPVRDTRQVCLPWRESNPRSEPRCALVTRLEWDGITLDMVNTHLSVRLGERQGQVATLLDSLGEPGVPLVLAGDFNCTPWSKPYRTLRGGLRCAASPRSWPSPLPVVPLDHILVRGPLRVVHGGVWRGAGARTASDHLPVVAELELVAAEAAA